jgi:shikimate kinase
MMGDKTIFLIGMMGSGKSTIGAHLAELLVLPFVDTDVAIQTAEDRSVQQIFEQEGEGYFREKEQQLLQQLPQQPGVVACGGGLPYFFNNMELLIAKGTVIYLEASPALLYDRIKGDNQRPKLQDFAAFVQLLTDREVIYNKAHFKIDAKQSVEEIIAEVLSLRAASSNQ